MLSDWPAVDRGRSQEGRLSQRSASKAPRLSQSALEPWPARSLPGAGKQGLRNSHLLRLTLLHKNHWILHASVTPLPLHGPMILCQQQVRASVVFFFPSPLLFACVGQWTSATVPYPVVSTVLEVPICQAAVMLSSASFGVPAHCLYSLCAHQNIFRAKNTETCLEELSNRNRFLCSICLCS